MQTLSTTSPQSKECYKRLATRVSFEFTYELWVTFSKVLKEVFSDMIQAASATFLKVFRHRNTFKNLPFAY